MAETESERKATFQQLADERLDASYRLANAILGDESESQDATHDAVPVAWQRWPSPRDLPPRYSLVAMLKIVTSPRRDGLRLLFGIVSS